MDKIEVENDRMTERAIQEFQGIKSEKIFCEYLKEPLGTTRRVSGSVKRSREARNDLGEI